MRSYRWRVYDDLGIEDDNIWKEFKEVISFLSVGVVVGVVVKVLSLFLFDMRKFRFILNCKKVEVFR